MNKFEKGLPDFLKDCEPLLKIEIAVVDKHVLISDSHIEAIQVKDKERTLSYAYNKALVDISNLQSFKNCQSEFETDNIFRDASKFAGIWGTFNEIMRDIIVNCGKIRKQKVILNSYIAIKRLSELRNEFGASNINFTSNARLLGVKLKCKQIILNNGLSIYRLNRKEKNIRLSEIMIPLLESENLHIVFQPTELKMVLNVPIDRSKDNAFFDSSNEASAIAAKAFDNVLDAILLVKEGVAELGPQILNGGPIKSTLTFRLKPKLVNLNITINEDDVNKIITAYGLVIDNSNKIDKIISSALHRFLIGRKRKDVEDKLIDYVIAWESILLTQKGRGLSQELNYRFSINGSSLIKACISGERKKLFQKMKSLYSLRSIFVHGKDSKEIKKDLEAGEFGDLNKACNFLENNFRAAIWWLIDIDKNERPYLKKEGWEELLWPA